MGEREAPRVGRQALVAVRKRPLAAPARGTPVYEGITT